MRILRIIFLLVLGFLLFWGASEMVSPIYNDATVYHAAICIVGLLSLTALIIGYKSTSHEGAFGNTFCLCVIPSAWWLFPYLIDSVSFPSWLFSLCSMILPVLFAQLSYSLKIERAE